MKKSLVIGALTAIVSLSLVGCAPKQINDSVTIEAGGELSLEAEDFFDSTDGITFDTTDVDTSKVGEYEVTVTYKKETYTITIKVEDTTAPEFELVQDSIVTNDVGSLDAESLVESVKDVSDTTAELKFDEEPKEDGDYTASVVVTDEYGNSAEKAISIAVDTTAPTISGVENETVKQADATAEPTIDFSKYSAEDSRDGAVECETSMEKTGDKEYTVTVTATDEAGNEAKETAVIKVEAIASKSAGSGKSASGGSTASSGTSSGSSTPAEESASASEPASEPASDEWTGPTKTTEELMAEVDANTIHQDSYYCGFCDIEIADYNEYVTHMQAHGVQ